ncbi:MAG: hypothetical protein RQ826_13425 [Xanthomonadales bacterium]|nr:hypothetical protein [Xanthomonadales bacterium]
MATVQLSDIIDVTVFQDLPAVNSPELTAFFESGVATRNPLLDQLANAAGRTAELPFWRDIDPDVAPNLSSDNPASSAIPAKVNQSEQTARKAFLNKGLSASDLASELALGPRAMEHIRSRVDTYWTRQWQRRLLAATNGVLADNVASNGSDMVHDAAGATNADVSATTVFTRQNFTSAAYTLGDQVDGIQAIAVHSVVHKRMVDNDDIDFIRDSQGNLVMQSFLGRRVIVDDSMPFTPAAGTLGTDAAPRYTSVLFGAGAFGWGNGSPEVPVEVQRDADQGDGGGIETLWTRRTWLLHPFGFQNTGTPAATSFSPAELAAAGTWSRIVDRKSVPISFLITNG